MNPPKQFQRTQQQLPQRQAQKSQSNFTPEYKKMGVEPVQFKQSAPFIGQVQNIPKNPPTIERYASMQKIPAQGFQAMNVQELEQEENEINHSDVEQTVVGSLMSHKVESYSFIISYQGEILAITSSQEEAEEYLDKLIFEDQNQIDIQKIDIWQKLPSPKVGVCLRK